MLISKDTLVSTVKGKDNRLDVLTEVRNNGEFNEDYMRYLESKGIFYSEDERTIEDKLGVSLKDLGIDEKKGYLMKDGWIIPTFDSAGYLMYFLNYSNERPANTKYFKILPESIKDIGVYGLDGLGDMLDKGYIVWVEGCFDQIRLSFNGIPSVATLGTYYRPYMKILGDRVKYNIIIPDNDKIKVVDGKEVVPYSIKFNKYLERTLKNTKVIALPSDYKDIDEIGLDIHLIGELKRMIGV